MLPFGIGLLVYTVTTTLIMRQNMSRYTIKYHKTQTN